MGDDKKIGKIFDFSVSSYEEKVTGDSKIFFKYFT